MAHGALLQKRPDFAVAGAETAAKVMRFLAQVAVEKSCMGSVVGSFENKV